MHTKNVSLLLHRNINFGKITTSAIQEIRKRSIGTPSDVTIEYCKLFAEDNDFVLHFNNSKNKFELIACNRYTHFTGFDKQNIELILKDLYKKMCSIKSKLSCYAIRQKKLSLDIFKS